MVTIAKTRDFDQRVITVVMTDEAETCTATVGLVYKLKVAQCVMEGDMLGVSLLYHEIYQRRTRVTDIDDHWSRYV